MRRRGKLGGQNKVPRMDNTGALTRDLLDFLRQTGQTGESSCQPADSRSALPPACD